MAKNNINLNKFKDSIGMHTKNKGKVKKFRLRGKRFFLTYPQLPKEFNLEQKALEHFETVFKMKRQDFSYVMSVEKHEDGNPHLHVYLKFNVAQGVYSVNKLDLTLDGESYHGNYQVVKSEHNTIQYILKSVDNYENIFKNIELPILKGKYYSNIHEHLYEVLKQDGYHAAVTLLYDQYPKEAIHRGSSLIQNMELASDYNKIKKSFKMNPKYTIGNFSNFSERLIDWIESDKPRAVLLSGPSGIGKTELAKAVFHKKGLKTLFIREKQGLKGFVEDFHKSVIFDDIDVDDFTREELIHLFDVDNESDIRILYKSVRIPAGIDKVFTTNTPEKFIRKDPALERRLYQIPLSDVTFIEAETVNILSEDESDDSDARVSVAESKDTHNFNY